MARNTTGPALRSCDGGQGFIRRADPQIRANLLPPLRCGSAPRPAGAHPVGGVSPVVREEDCPGSVKAARIRSTASVLRLDGGRGLGLPGHRPAAARDRPKSVSTNVRIPI